jgi:hypothetical protein
VLITRHKGEVKGINIFRCRCNESLKTGTEGHFIYTDDARVFYYYFITDESRTTGNT